jgi:hypothetical protein
MLVAMMLAHDCGTAIVSHAGDEMRIFFARREMHVNPSGDPSRFNCPKAGLTLIGYALGWCEGSKRNTVSCKGKNKKPLYAETSVL